MFNDAHRLDTFEYQAPVEMPVVAGVAERRGFFGRVHDHPFAGAILAAVLLVLLGGIVVIRKASVSPVGGNSSAWGGASITVLSPTSYGDKPQETYQPTAIDRQIESAPVYTYNPLPVDTGSSYSEAPTNTDTASQGGFNFDAFVQSITHKSGAQTDVSTDTAGAYDFIPNGHVATSTQTQTRTDTQQKLYEYGNEAGSYIQSYEDAHTNQAQVLKNQIEDRADANKAAQVTRIANDLRGIGEGMASMEDVPDAVSSLHTKLAKSYIDIGTKLADVPKAQTDEQFIQAIETYNAAADMFAKNYVAMVETFSALGVKFDSGDPGSVFMFSPSQL